MPLLLAALLALSAAAAWRTLDQCNPDAISYLLLAEHWRGLRLDLAISGYWSPGFVWLLVPLSALLPAWTALRVAMVVSAVVFVWTSRHALRELGLSPPARRLGDWLLVVTAAAAVGKEVSPDLLGAGFFALAVARCVRPGRSGFSRDLGTGALFGLAYLAKAANLPAAALVVAFVMLVRWRTGATLAAVAVRGAAILLGGALVAGPWVGILTRQYGAFTVSTAAPRNHAVMGRQLGMREHPTFTSLHALPPGRLTTWEDPPLSLYTPWSPFASAERLQHQVAVVAANVPVLRRRLLAADWLGLGAACALLAALLRCRRAPLGATSPASAVAEPSVEPSTPGWAWSALPFAATALTYAPFYADSERYFYGLVPFALAAALGLCLDSALAPTGKRWRFAAAVLAASFLAVSVPSLGRTLAGWRHDPVTAEARDMAAVVAAAGATGPIASIGNHGHVAFFVAWFNRQPSLGNTWQADAFDQLESLGARVAVVAADAPAAVRLAASPDWQRLGADRNWSLQVFTRRAAATPR